MKDNNFYLNVLENEEPGQFGNEFKLHVFKNKEDVEFD